MGQYTLHMWTDSESNIAYHCGRGCRSLVKIRSLMRIQKFRDPHTSGPLCLFLSASNVTQCLTQSSSVTCSICPNTLVCPINWPAHVTAILWSQHVFPIFPCGTIHPFEQTYLISLFRWQYMYFNSWLSTVIGPICRDLTAVCHCRKFNSLQPASLGLWILKRL